MNNIEELKTLLNSIADSTDNRHSLFLQTEECMLNNIDGACTISDFKDLMGSEDLADSVKHIISAFAKSDGFTDGVMNLSEGMTSYTEFLYDEKEKNITVMNDNEKIEVNLSAPTENTDIDNATTDADFMSTAAENASNTVKVDSEFLPIGSNTEDTLDDMEEQGINNESAQVENENIIENEDDNIESTSVEENTEIIDNNNPITEEQIANEVEEQEDFVSDPEAEARAYDKYSSLTDAVSSMDDKKSDYAENLISNTEKGFIPLEMRPDSSESAFISEYKDFKLTNENIKDISSSELSRISPRLSGKDYGTFFGCDTKTTNYLMDNNGSVDTKQTTNNVSEAKDFKNELNDYIDPSKRDSIEHIYVNIDLPKSDSFGKAKDIEVGDTVIHDYNPFAVYTFEVHTYEPTTNTRDIEYKSFIGNTNGEIYTDISNSGNAPISKMSNCDAIATCTFDGKVTQEVEDYIDNSNQSAIKDACNTESAIIKNTNTTNGLSKEDIKDLKDISKANLNITYAKNAMETKEMLEDYKVISDKALDIANNIQALDTYQPDSSDYNDMQAKIDSAKSEFKADFEDFVSKYPNAQNVINTNRADLKDAVNTYKETSNVITNAQTNLDFSNSEYVTGKDINGNDIDSKERLNGLINRATTGEIASGTIGTSSITEEEFTKAKEYLQEKVDTWNENHPDNQLTFDDDNCKIYDKHGIERGVQSETGMYDRSFNADFVKDGESRPEPDKETGDVGIAEIEDFENKLEDNKLYKEFEDEFETSDIKVAYDEHDYMSVIDEYLPQKDDLENKQNDIDSSDEPSTRVDDNKTDNNDTRSSIAIDSKINPKEKKTDVSTFVNPSGKIEVNDKMKVKLRAEAESAVSKNLSPAQRKAEVDKIYNQKLDQANAKLENLANKIKGLNFEVTSRRDMIGNFASRYNVFDSVDSIRLGNLCSEYKLAGGMVGKDSVVKATPSVFHRIGNVFEFLTSLKGSLDVSPISEIYYQLRKPDNPYTNVDNNADKIVADNSKDTPKDVEKPQTEDTPKDVEKPQTEDTPKDVEKPQTEDTPKDVEKPQTEDTPKDVEKPQTEDTPKDVEKPQTEDTPKDVEKPQTEDTPKDVENEISDAQQNAVENAEQQEIESEATKVETQPDADITKDGETPDKTAEEPQDIKENEIEQPNEASDIEEEPEDVSETDNLQEKLSDDDAAAVEDAGDIAEGDIAYSDDTESKSTESATETGDKQDLSDEISEKIDSFTDGYSDAYEDFSELVKDGNSIDEMINDMADIMNESFMDKFDNLDEFLDKSSDLINNFCDAVGDNSGYNSEDIREKLENALSERSDLSEDVIDRLMDETYDKANSGDELMTNMEEDGVIDGVNMSDIETADDMTSNDYDNIEKTLSDSPTGDSSTDADIGNDIATSEDIDEAINKLVSEGYTEEAATDIAEEASRLLADESNDVTDYDDAVEQARMEYDNSAQMETEIPETETVSVDNTTAVDGGDTATTGDDVGTDLDVDLDPSEFEEGAEAAEDIAKFFL